MSQGLSVTWSKSLVFSRFVSDVEQVTGCIIVCQYRRASHWMSQGLSVSWSKSLDVSRFVSDMEQVIGCLKVCQ